jgi:glycosyltransferase involved in cell wall biosynthesis
MHGPSSKSVLLLDISRLIWRARRRGPTGIDRVELAYAQHFIAGASERPAYAVLHLLGLVFAVSPSGGRRFIEDLAMRWQGSAPNKRWANLRSVIRLYARLLRNLWISGPWLRRKLRGYPGSPFFLVVSHHHVSRNYTIDRLRCALNVKPVCFIHDLLPVDYPEYFKAGWERRYQRLASNVGRLFDAAIANSETTASALRVCLKEEPGEALSCRTIRVAAPGVRAFQPAPVTSSTSGDRPYFVVLGTIEPRKNHLLLLNLWARLATTVASPPRLLVIGHRGWENEQVVDMLERSRRLRGLVEEHNGLCDAQVGALLCGARALLLPSFAEGFGLPLAEALASGIPAICSDIPVFRELGLDAPEYLDPLDLQSWMDVVIDFSSSDSGRRAAQMKRLAAWRPPSWSDHFGTVEQLLAEMDTRHSPLPAVVDAPAGVSQALESP